MSTLTGKYFPLGDEPNGGELAALRVEDQVGVRAMATGEFRPPYKGEWFCFWQLHRGLPGRKRPEILIPHRQAGRRLAAYRSP